MAISHQALCDSIQLLNTIFFLQLLNCFLFTLIYNTLSPFGVFSLARSKTYNSFVYYYVLFSTIWCSYYNFFVVNIVAWASLVAREGKKTRVEVHGLITNQIDSATVQMLSSFSMQIEHSSVYVSSGMFVYDWTLLYLVRLNIYEFFQTCNWTIHSKQIFTSNISYLIVLIQFDG